MEARVTNLREVAAMTQVFSPTTVPEALHTLASGWPDVRPLAGGTDAMVKGRGSRAWISLHRVRPELGEISRDGATVRIGAMATFSEMLRSPLLAEAAPLLLQAVRTIGGPQIRNLGTLGGNLGTASPAGDSLPALYALDARVHLLSLRGERVMPINRFLLGPGHLGLEPGELISAVSFNAQGASELCTYEKLGLRAAHAIAIASAAIRLIPGHEGHDVAAARVALGAVAPTVLRVLTAEAALTHVQHVDGAAVERAAAAARAAAQPISDIRASASYRRAMAGNLVARGLLRLMPGLSEVGANG